MGLLFLGLSLLLNFELGQAHMHSLRHIKIMVPNELRNNVSDLIDLGHLDQQRQVVDEHVVLHVVVPTKDRQPAFWLQHVAGGGVVN